MQDRALLAKLPRGVTIKGGGGLWSVWMAGGVVPMQTARTLRDALAALVAAGESVRTGKTRARLDRIRALLGEVSDG